MKVEFITRQVCPLCDEARDMLGRLTRRFALEIDEIDVDTDEELLSYYGASVPVLRTPEHTILAAGKWTESGLISALTRFRLLGR